MKLIDWLVETYFPDRFVPREDFDQVQNREFPAVKREMDGLRSAVNHLTSENHKLICDGLHSHAFLPKFADERGTVDVEMQTHRVRERFETRVMVSVSDDARRYVNGRLQPQVFSDLARMLAEHIKQNLLRKFEPPYPGAPA